MSAVLNSFTRTIALPVEADTERASANLDQNVLTIDVPKKPTVSRVHQLVIATEDGKTNATGRKTGAVQAA